MFAITSRWSILVVLFVTRLTMAFQFQSVAALSPLIIEDYAVSLADIGLLIGLYLAPGVIVAIPGGAIAARFGDKRIVSLSMILMLAGGALIGFGPGWGSLVAGSVLAGVGGVIINVVMTKMLVDWFIGREIATAMAIYINSWPVGIALALLILPNLAAMGGLALAWAAVMSFIAAGLVLFLLIYRAPESAVVSAVRIKVQKLPVLALFLAAVIWGLYNAALAMVFSFGPALLNQQGWSLTSAGSMTSVFMIVFSVFLPLGGILADRTGRRDTVIMTSLLGYALLMPLALYAPPAVVPIIFVVVGLLFSLCAGPMMTLPSLILPPESRAFGMGVFWSIYYGVMMAAPTLAGGLADRAGNAGVAFILGSLMLVVCMIALALFRRVSAAQFIIATRYLDGEGTQPDVARAAHWYQKAATAGLAPAQYRLATLFKHGRGLPKDASKALFWYQRATEQGNIRAMHNAAVIAAGTEAGTPSPNKSVAPTPAAPVKAQSSINAVDGILTGSLLPQRTDATLSSIVTEPGSTANEPEAPPSELGPEALRQAAEHGDPAAQFIIATRYLDGEGTQPDVARAAHWYQKAATAGLAPAQYRLATLFERGCGLPKDASKALFWYQRAAEQGNIKAMHNAAVIAVGTEAGKANYDLAYKWFLAASQNGLKDSQFNLAVLYERGLGTKVNAGEALFWYTIAANQNDADAQKLVAALSKSLAPSIVNAVHAKVLAWIPLQAPANANADWPTGPGMQGSYSSLDH